MQTIMMHIYSMHSNLSMFVCMGSKHCIIILYILYLMFCILYIVFYAFYTMHWARCWHFTNREENNNTNKKMVTYAHLQAIIKTVQTFRSHSVKPRPLTSEHCKELSIYGPLWTAVDRCGPLWNVLNHQELISLII